MSKILPLPSASRVGLGRVVDLLEHPRDGEHEGRLEGRRGRRAGSSCPGVWPMTVRVLIAADLDDAGEHVGQRDEQQHRAVARRGSCPADVMPLLDLEQEVRRGSARSPSGGRSCRWCRSAWRRVSAFRRGPALVELVVGRRRCRPRDSWSMAPSSMTPDRFSSGAWSRTAVHGAACSAVSTIDARWRRSRRGSRRPGRRWRSLVDRDDDGAGGPDREVAGRVHS